MYAKRKYGKRKGVRKYRRRTTTTVSRKVRKYVKREIHRQVENKETSLTILNQGLVIPQSGGSNVYKIALLPSLANGTNNHHRIGNNVRPRYAYIKGHINILPYNQSTNLVAGPIWVRMLLIKALNVTYQGGAPGEIDSSIFKADGASLGFQSNMLDQILEVNNDLFRCLYDRKVKVGAGFNTSTGPVGSGYYFDNSPMSVPFKIVYTKYMKKLLKYSDSANGNSCQNDNLYLLFCPSTADGGSYGGSIPAETHFCRYFTFEDA